MTCFAFTANDLTVKTGTTTLFLRNDSDEICGERHDLVIGTDFDHPLATSDWISRDQAELFSVSGLPPGNYVFWCSVGLHRGLGMTGTLTVTRWAAPLSPRPPDPPSRLSKRSNRRTQASVARAFRTPGTGIKPAGLAPRT
jgi:plastocyanin